MRLRNTLIALCVLILLSIPVAGDLAPQPVLFIKLQYEGSDIDEPAVICGFREDFSRNGFPLNDLDIIQDNKSFIEQGFRGICIDCPDGSCRVLWDQVYRDEEDYTVSFHMKILVFYPATLKSLQ
ncbi:hypothetical protein ACFLRC_01645, partial [Candidatus Altiarchaeota archaeon]